MDLKEKKLASKSIYKGHIVNLFVDDVLCPNGHKSTREVIRHCKAACVVAKLPNGKYILEKQFRYPYDEVIYEIPAGKTDEGETTLTTAKRELEEETGYRPNKVEFLGTFYPSPAYTDEIIDMYYAEDLVKTEQHLDENEAINLMEVTLDELKDMIKNNEIKDGKTLAAIFEFILKIK
jgi:ADP-ribose pyrophosphatase